MKTIIPLDKALHFAAGIAVAIAALILWQVAMLVPALAAHPLPTGISLCGFLSGAQKEATDRLDNLLMHRRGQAPLHGVQWLDWLSTWAGASAVAYTLVRMGVA